MERQAYSFHPRAEKHIGKPDSIKRALCGTPFRMESNTPTLFRWQCGRTGDGEKRPQSRRRPAGRPTDLLPPNRIPSPKPAAAGTAVFAAAVFMLLPGKNGKAAAGRSTGGGRRGGQDPGSERSRGRGRKAPRRGGGEAAGTGRRPVSSPRSGDALRGGPGFCRDWGYSKPWRCSAGRSRQVSRAASRILTTSHGRKGTTQAEKLAIKGVPESTEYHRVPKK